MKKNTDKYDVKTIKFCLLCEAEFIPPEGVDHRGFCYKHRSLYWQSWYEKYEKKMDRSKYKATQKKAWDNWV